jgi:glutamine amidotransferase
MCLAIYKPAGVDIPHKNFKNAFEHHPDGAGIAWAVDGILLMRKGIFNVDDFIEQYEKVKQYHCLIHFRKATHGKIDATNCHPFLFNNNKLALVHNGILPIKCSIEGLSDTAHFVKLVLEPMVTQHKVPINDGALNYLISTSIGTDKLAVMDGAGTTYIFNEEKGNWDEGVWYSNTSYKFPPYKASDYKSHPYFSNNNNNTRYSRHTNWRRHWDGSNEEADESYLDFWRKNSSSAATTTIETDPKKTRQPLLLPGIRESVDDAGNVIVDVEAETVEEKPKYSEGQMCEYGWFDESVESDIQTYQTNLGLTREEALIRIFTER